jgi:hypothetical protein
MSQANENPNTSDDALLDLVGHHNRLWAEWRQVRADRPSNLAVLGTQCDMVARRIIAMAAFTRRGLMAKRGVVERSAFDDNDLIIMTILEMDAERVEQATGEDEESEQA